MSNYHVLEQNDIVDQATVAYHISIPDELNGASVNLRTCLKQYLNRDIEGGIIKSNIPWLAADFAAELTQIQNGEIYEHIEGTQYNYWESDLQKRTMLDNRYNALVIAIPNRIRKILRYWGMNRTI